mmetsp:Transcript_69147/g.122096  ORF Transcript_69147/g.122096 Transcript_69147/m.122096 type:complete len:189 (+) Transcript_69147:4179-4745(+)
MLRLWLGLAHREGVDETVPVTDCEEERVELAVDVRVGSGVQEAVVLTVEVTDDPVALGPDPVSLSVREAVPVGLDELVALCDQLGEGVGLDWDCDWLALCGLVVVGVQVADLLQALLGLTLVVDEAEQDGWVEADREQEVVGDAEVVHECVECVCDDWDADWKEKDFVCEVVGLGELVCDAVSGAVWL